MKINKQTVNDVTNYINNNNLRNISNLKMKTRDTTLYKECYNELVSIRSSITSQDDIVKLLHNPLDILGFDRRVSPYGYYIKDTSILDLCEKVEKELGIIPVHHYSRVNPLLGQYILLGSIPGYRLEDNKKRVTYLLEDLGITEYNSIGVESHLQRWEFSPPEGYLYLDKFKYLLLAYISNEEIHGAELHLPSSSNTWEYTYLTPIELQEKRKDIKFSSLDVALDPTKEDEEAIKDRSLVEEL